MRFLKMHGAGNDYVYINGFEVNISDPSELAIRVSDRHFGIGSDGLVIIRPSETCDFRMSMYNADGSEAEMCGNASRCVGKYVFDNGMTDKTELTLETKAGIKQLNLDVVDGQVATVCVDMEEPILTPSLIPVKADGETAIRIPIEIAGNTYHATCVSMGNPHAIIFVDDVDLFDVHGVGHQIEVHPLFPKKTNVEFVQIVSPTVLKMRVWERGSGETLACGTGACATLVASVLNGLSSRKATIKLRGGDLKIEWRESNNRIYMTGGATKVFEGELF
ncbi:MAG: diaminopimelate epimerase [Bacteroidales bacterium]|nr:diaminopimelate epimerase [Bacteroidales bacterium]